jgi:hypothetical protein
MVSAIIRTESKIAVNYAFTGGALWNTSADIWKTASWN